MYIKQLHTLIEQGLQNIGVFAYADMLPEELDLAINDRMIKMMDEQVQPLKNVKSKELKFKLQYILDRFQNLQVKELPLDVTLVDNVYVADLPDNYLHLIADISKVLSECNLANVTTGSIQEGNFYLVKGQKSIIYNGDTYPTGSIFVGVRVAGYTYSGTGTLLLIKLEANKRANRLTEEEYLYQVLDNSLEQTDVDSPVSSLSSNQLFTYVDGFYIDKTYLTYLRKPKLVNSFFITYSISEDLVIGQKYESVDNNITYNTIVYKPFTPFIIVSGHLRYTGTATVRSYQDGDCEFNDSMSGLLKDLVVLDLSVDTEQAQQKIVNKAQQIQQENV